MSEALIPIESHPAVASLIEDLEQYAEASLAASTRRAYEGDLKAFQDWCTRLGRPAVPASPETVMLYVAELARRDVGTGERARRRSLSSVKRALAAICSAQTTRGHESPRAHKLFRRVLRGLRRKLGGAVRKKAPLLNTELKAVVEALPATVAGARDRALLLLGFAGGFRRAELAALDVEDLADAEGGMIVRVRRSKTDQEAEGQRVGIPFGTSPTTCPVRAVKDWLRLMESAPTAAPRRRRQAAGRGSALFREVTRYGALGAALSDRGVAIVIQRAVAGCPAMAGRDPNAYGGHSLRAGLITSAARAGKEERKIMEQTRHASVTTMRGYIREAGLFEDNATEGLL